MTSMKTAKAKTQADPLSVIVVGAGMVGMAIR